MLKVVSCSAIDKFDLSIGDIKDHKDFELCGILIVDRENEISFRVDDTSANVMTVECCSLQIC